MQMIEFIVARKSQTNTNSHDDVLPPQPTRYRLVLQKSFKVTFMTFIASIVFCSNPNLLWTIYFPQNYIHNNHIRLYLAKFDCFNQICYDIWRNIEK